jgi:DNA repair protein RecO (recombination protein O)
MFVSEVLHHSIHEEERVAFDFLEAALLWLDNHDEMANFHLILMLETTKYLGFYPDTSDMDMPFEMTEGVLPLFTLLVL